MLKNLDLQHFTIISELALEFAPGLTVLTGETGAGKSILLDALEIALGERADTSLIQQGSERCEISLTFAVHNIVSAQQWLLEQALDEEGDECIIRRVISRDGRSRSSINGRPCSLQQVRELGALLVHIHGQNKHSLLLKPAYQRQLLDEFAQLQALCSSVHECYEQWRQAQNELETQQTGGFGLDAQKELLGFQLQELEQLALTEGEWGQLLTEQSQLAHAAQWIAAAQQIMDTLVEDEQYSTLRRLHQAHQQLRDLSQRTQGIDRVAAALEFVKQATIQIQEAHIEVRAYFQTLETNPERLHTVEQRLALIHDMARKHKINPEDVLLKQQALQAEYDRLAQVDQHLIALQEQVKHWSERYTQLAEQLTAARSQAAKVLQKKITEQIRRLGIAHGELNIQLSPYSPQVPHPFGNEQVEFLVTTNPGQPLQALSKVASGGELSRMALAIQVVTVQENTLPTIIFDEVDVGVGGRTAQIVGEQLRKLAGNAQVLCVTHLPQVAAQGHQHLQIQKVVKKENVNTVIRSLLAEERTAEIARMLGGVTITKTTLAHAREMLGLEP